MRPAHIALAAVSILFAVTASSERAQACGGTFCDSGPTAMPVDQSGENILFVLDGTSVEAHVQIQYQGSAERFAWIVPMPEVPTVSVGSQLLFQNMLQGTVPTYGYFQQSDFCGGGYGGGGGFSAGGSSAGGSGGAAGSTNGGPTVVYKATVGAFEVTVLKGGTAQEVSDWLTQNNYQGIPSAPAILADYVAKNFVFVAIKLTAGAGIDEIHPLVFKYPGNEPCVPLKLTAVAATEDMGVRTFFLGNDRVVPTNYKHVELNPVRIDWQQYAANYQQVVSQGADSAIANGKAFVTEYAGSSNVVSTYNVYSSTWNSASFATIAPEAVVDTLTSQGLISCYNYGSGSFTCQYIHPLLLPLLKQYLPAPAGVTDDDFYGCLSCNVAKIDSTKWNAQEFAADFQLRIVDPGQHAANLIAKWPYLTRMFTTISPAEMTLDPDFHPHPGLSTVAPGQQATRRTACNGASGMILPDTRQVALDQGQWPVWDTLMPFAEKIVEYPEDGSAPIVLVDNTDKINKQLALWNAAHSWPPTPWNGGGVGGFPGGVGYAGSGNYTGSGAKQGKAGNANNAEASGGGCALGGNDGSTGLVMLIGAVGLFLARRREHGRL